MAPTLTPTSSEARHVLGRRLAALPRRRPRGVPGRPRPQPLGRPPGRPTAGPCPPPAPSTAAPSPARPGWTRATAQQAVRASLDQHRAWRHVPLDERRARVAATLDALTEHRELLALLLVWEIGKPWRLAQADVDRAIDGVRWYVDGIEPMLDGRAPLDGPVVQHRQLELPDERARSRHAGTGTGRQRGHRQDPDRRRRRLPHPGLRARRPRGDPRHPGQRQRRRAVRGAGPRARDRLRLLRRRPRHRRRGGHRRRRPRQAARTRTGGPQHLGHLELHGLGRARPPSSPSSSTTASSAAPRTRASSSSARCSTSSWRPTSRPSAPLRVGHPLAVEHPDDPLPELDFGPRDQRGQGQGAARPGRRGHRPRRRPAAPRQRWPTRRFLPGQDTSAYVQPVTLLNPPPSSPLHHAEPFGPVDTIVLVDTEAELLAAMNASQRRAGRHPVHRRPGDVRPAGPADPRVQGRPRQAPLARRPRRAVRRASARPGAAPSSAASCWCAPSRRGPAGERLPGNFPEYQLMP